MKYINCRCAITPMEDQMAVAEKNLDRLNSMMHQTESLIDQLYGATDIDPTLATTAEHLEAVLGDLNFTQVQLIEKSGPIVK